MTEEQDQTLESGAAEATAGTEPVTPEPQADPLDQIQDETARAEAKKHRAIARRLGDKAPEPAPAPLQAASKNDLALIVTNQAKELVSDEVREQWDELSKIPLGGFNPMNARSIADNMAQRLVLQKSYQKPDSGTAPLTQTRAQGQAGTHGEAKPSKIPRMLTADQQAEKLYGPSK